MPSSGPGFPVFSIVTSLSFASSIPEAWSVHVNGRQSPQQKHYSSATRRTDLTLHSGGERLKGSSPLPFQVRASLPNIKHVMTDKKRYVYMPIFAAGESRWRFDAS